MPDNSGKQEESTWPMPTYPFQLEIGESSDIASFQEISGLDTGSQVIDYRQGGDLAFSRVKLPGMAKFGNVTLKRGIFVAEGSFWDWFSQIRMNTIKRETMVISMLDENAAVIMKWTLSNAWPFKVSGIDLKSEGNDVAIESLEIAHEGLTVS